MKKNKTKLLIIAGAAAFSLGLTPALIGQGTSGTGSTSSSRSDSDVKSAATLDTPSADHLTVIGKANKASSLLGMDVRNQQNEKLGEIKDLVVDMQSGKVAYAVVSVGGFLGIGDKYVAVPPSAFNTAPDQDRLVLNADKAKLQNAPIFAKSDWPDLNSASWRTDSAYWLTDSTAQGTAGTTHSATGTATSSTDALRSTDLDRTTERHDTTDRLTMDRTDRDHAGDDRETFRGRIAAINPETRTLTVEGPSGSREFKLADRATLTLKENRNPRLVDFKVGYPVVVGFHNDNGSYVAHSVIRSDAPEVK